MGNQQLTNLSNNQIQVLLTGRIGDGCYHRRDKSQNYTVTYSSIHHEYMLFKKYLLGSICQPSICVRQQRSNYKAGAIYSIVVNTETTVNYIAEMDLEAILYELDELGLAIWFYDDGTLHKNKHFYQLSTHSYTEEEHFYVLAPFFASHGIIARPTIERKRDGREFWYLGIGKYQGADKVNALLNKYPLDCFKYKLWSSETSQQWRKFQEELKSREQDRNRILTGAEKGAIWRGLAKI